MGAAWLCLHIMEHYAFTGDEEFLREYYPLMKEAADFFAETLITGPADRLMVSPSCSPENTYVLEGGSRGCLCEGWGGTPAEAWTSYETLKQVLGAGLFPAKI